jgi:putative transposase
MSRPLRIEHPYAWYHVMNRSRRGEAIFSEQRDYNLFGELLKECVELWHVRIAAYCLMPGHDYLAVHSPVANLARCMGHVNGVHSLRVNPAHRYDGPLFRGLYRAILVEVDPYPLQLTRYIHPWPLAIPAPWPSRHGQAGRFNPVRADVVQDLFSSLRRQPVIRP